MKLLGMHDMYQFDIMSVTTSPAFVLLHLFLLKAAWLCYYRLYLTAIISLLADS